MANTLLNPVLYQRLTALAAVLKTQNSTLATAESCTGGLLASCITELPGSSSFFKGGVVSYDNSIKKSILRVSNESLERFGAVSKEVAIEMAEGALLSLATVFALSTTGIAGPGGGSLDKPVGTVWICLASLGKASIAKKYLFVGDRSEIRMQTVDACIDLLLLNCEGYIKKDRN